MFDGEKNYVKDDTIQLEVKIEAEDPKSLSRSIMKFKCIEEPCDCACQVANELTVMNVSNLMAVRSPEFVMHGMPWYIVVFKDDTNLSVFFKIDATLGTRIVTIAVQLVSSRANVDSIEKTDTQKIQWPKMLFIGDLVSWEEMLKPQNGFVSDDSNTLKIRIKSDKPVGDLSNISRNNVAKRHRLECTICLEELYDQDLSITPCSHSFRTACITKAVRKRRVCPLCKAAVQLNELRPLYLSA